MSDIEIKTRLSGVIKDYVPVSMLDWEGKVAAVLFTGGCNFSCAFCHNPDLVRHPQSLQPVPLEEICEYLKNKKGWIDGVVITGGEPTLVPGLRDIIDEIRSMDFPVKLDTNGSRPDVITDLISEGFLEYIAMDIKTTFEKYPSVTKSDCHVKSVIESINLIIRSNIDHEFRTTAYPGAVTLDEIVEISRYIGDMSANRYAIQQFRNDKVLSEEAINVKPYWIKDLETVLEECNKNLPTKLR